MIRAGTVWIWLEVLSAKYTSKMLAESTLLPFSAWSIFKMLDWLFLNAVMLALLSKGSALALSSLTRNTEFHNRAAEAIFSLLEWLRE